MHLRRQQYMTGRLRGQDNMISICLTGGRLDTTNSTASGQCHTPSMHERGHLIKGAMPGRTCM